jgi:hypothetical protein
MKTKINLLISLYHIEDEERKSEVVYCLSKNLNNKYIATITVLNEGFYHPILNNEKVRNIKADNRPTYSDFLPFMDASAINIIANCDIWYDDTLSKLKSLRWHRKMVYLLCRREKDGQIIGVAGNAHDSWAFFGKPAALRLANFYMGIPHCEQRLAAVMHDCGYFVLNPSKFITTWHEHKSEIRAYYSTGENYDGSCLVVKPANQFEVRLLYAVLWYLKKKKYFYRRYNENGQIFDR